MSKNNTNLIFVFLIGFISCWFFMPQKQEQGHNIINTILNTIGQNYVDTIDANYLREQAIHQILENLDPHSIYMNQDDVAQASVMMAGSFEGIGIEFSIHRDTIIVINVIPNGPSEKKGIQAGERITYINNEQVCGIGITNTQVIEKLRGKRGTIVNVGINTKHDTITKFVDIKRDKIPLVSLDVAYEIAPSIGYIKLNRFAATTFKEFKNELKRLKDDNNITKLILDLRGNSGGYLDQAVKILNEFFDNNKLLVYTEGHARKKQEYFSDFFGTFKDGEVYVLINEGSASASEIIAGAIQDHDRGLIIGGRSFGKGLVQEQILLDNGGLMRLTVSRYYTPSGRCIQKPYYESLKSHFSELDLNNKIQADSLQKFKTMSGRIVYGGGGIEPDHAIQDKYDSIPATLVYLYTSDFFQNLVFDYVDENRIELGQIQELEKFSIPDKRQIDLLLTINKWFTNEIPEIDDITEYANSIKQYKDDIMIRLSALIIRQYWGWGEMQIFLNQHDEIITTSLSLINN